MIVAKARMLAWRIARATTVACMVTGCYPRYDWREHRPECTRVWCGFVATFPGKPISATREIPVGALRLPLSATIVSVGDVSFAVLSFDLQSAGSAGGNAAAARVVLEKKLLDDIGAQGGRTRAVTMRAADRSEIPAEGFDAEGVRERKPMTVAARLAERHGHLFEILVVGPTDVLATDTGRQAVETFITSLRLD